MKNTYLSLYIFRLINLSDGWNVHKLTKILSWNVTKYSLPYSTLTISIVDVVLGTHWSKIINSWYDVIIWTFEPRNFSANPFVCVYIYIYIYKLIYIYIYKLAWIITCCLNILSSMYIYIYIEEGIFRQQVIIQASFVSDDGTLFIIFYYYQNSKNSTVNSTILLMTTKSMVEIARAEDMGQFLYLIDPDTRKITRSLEKIKLEIINSVPTSLRKLAWMSIYIYIYIYILNAYIFI